MSLSGTDQLVLFAAERDLDAAVTAAAHRAAAILSGEGAVTMMNALLLGLLAGAGLGSAVTWLVYRARYRALVAEVAQADARAQAATRAVINTLREHTDDQGSA